MCEHQAPLELIMHRQYLQIFIAAFCFTFQLTSFAQANNDEEWAFPDGFLIGAGTSAYQIEGAWNISDKSESNWDRYTHTQPESIINGDNGDIACDSYHKFKEDVQLLKNLGMDHYRFSISWSRILPTGYPNKVSKDGIKYYNDLLDELEKYNIKPLVTIYQWDHPQVIEDLGGWMNEIMVDLFAEYARVVFKEFGHRVQIFSTLSEPRIFCLLAYTAGKAPPGLKLGKFAEYLCGHNMLKAHAKAYHIYKNEFRTKQQGKVGIDLACVNFYSKNKNDSISPEVAFQFNCGRFATPIFSKSGDYPEILKTRIAENSKYEGLEQSRLPVFSKEWIQLIKGSADFFGLNHYYSQIVEPAPKPQDTVYVNDDGLIYSYDPSWPTTPTDRIKVTPEGFRDVLKKIKSEYGNPLVLVRENGVGDDGSLYDGQRQEYLYLYMKAMLTAIYKDGCNVQCYTIWSLIDNFEWDSGYSSKFGIFHVDYQDPNRKRTAKSSVTWISNVLRTRKLLPISA